MLVRVKDGLVDWGEAFGHAAIPATKAALDGIVAPLVVGRDAGDINAITRQVLHGFTCWRNGPSSLPSRHRDGVVGPARQTVRPAHLAPGGGNADAGIDLPSGGNVDLMHTAVAARRLSPHQAHGDA